MTPAPNGDGRGDFDFLFGEWTVRNRRLRDPLGDGPEDWIEFDATVHTRPILAGLGNIDAFSTPSFPERGAYEGIALRLFDGAEGVWRIWWASTGVGVLDTPVVGRFDGRHGLFECDDVLAGRAVSVRYEWFRDGDGADAPCWQQSFSFDGGQTWQPNWTMALRRSH